MSNVAGVLNLIVLFFGFFISSFIEQSFFLKLVERIFMAKTNDKSIMN